MTLTEALKKRDEEEVYAILTKAADEWSMVDDSYTVQAAYEFIPSSRDKFDLEEWVCGLCLNVLNEFIESEGEKTGCDEMMESGSFRCCARNMAFALFLHNKFEDEYDDILRELTAINESE